MSRARHFSRLFTGRGGIALIPERRKVGHSDILARAFCANKHQEKFAPPAEFQKLARIPDEASYKKMWQRSVDDPSTFWGEIAEGFEWLKKWDKVCSGNFELKSLEHEGIKWFEGAKLNVTVNCLDRHIAKRGDQPALTFEADNGETQQLTFRQLLERVCRMANLLKARGVKKGDVVTVYMPMIPELAVTVLACARIGAIHSVVFSGFSSNALATRIVASKSTCIVTSDVAVRGGKVQAVKASADAAIAIAEADEGGNKVSTDVFSCDCQ